MAHACGRQYRNQYIDPQDDEGWHHPDDVFHRERASARRDPDTVQDQEDAQSHPYQLC